MKSVTLAALAVAALSSTAAAQQPAPAAPAASAVVSKNPTGASAGAYNLDSRHTSVIARLDHMGGLSKSVFRFNDVKGTLQWDPAQPERSQLSVTVDPKSLDTPVAGFAEELAGERFLNLARFPDIKFVSRSIRRTAPDRGQITGDLTFFGQTRPVVLDAVFNGWRKNNRGIDSLGFHATAKIDRREFGFTGGQGGIGNEIEFVIDTEFNKAP